MKDIILVNIARDHTWECSTNIIGRTGEGDIAVFKILLTEEKMSNYSVYLEFEKSNKEKFRSKELNVVNNIAFYQIPKYLLAESGRLRVQLILEKNSSKLWGSNVKTYYVLESISGMEELPEIESDVYIPTEEDLIIGGDTPSEGGNTTPTVTTLTNTKWVINNNITYEDKLNTATGSINKGTDFTLNINFTSNGQSFTKMVFLPDTGLIYVNSSTDIPAYIVGTIDLDIPQQGDSLWVDEAYKTIIITGGADANSTEAYNLISGMATKVTSGSGANGLPIEVFTEEEMNSLLISENMGKVYRYVGTTGTFVNNGLYQVVSD